MGKNNPMSEPVETLITIPFEEPLVAKLQSISPRLKITVSRARKAEEITPEIWTTVEVLYTSRALPAPDQAPNLRWIQFHWAGIDHAVNAPILQKPEMKITTLSGAASSQVAEYVLMMLVSLGHRLPDMLAHQRRGEWPKDRFERFNPRELRGSIVGIVGYGSIGRQIARLLFPSGAKVLATKRDVMHPTDTGFSPEGLGDSNADFVTRLYPSEAMKSMLKECDFVVVTVPLTASTRNLLDAEALAAMKSSAYLIDVSRGGVIDQAALVTALKEKRIAGAALDVFPEEPLPDDNPLWKLSNVVLTPHISGNTPYYDERAVELFAENLHRYLAGMPLYNQFNLDLGY
jgi:phosphoglycerate dehydrogenase-like enzyme